MSIGKQSWTVGVVAPTAKTERPVVQHDILIVDQSGSMYWATEKVANDMIEYVNGLEQGRVLSIGYFSGVGDFRWFIIGRVLNTPDDYKRVEKLIRDNARARNTTCFSEILMDLDTLLEQCSALADLSNLVFLTDGHPVVPFYKKEVDAIFAAIDKVKTRLSNVLIIGYGDYYNRDLLSKMAIAFGGALQHLDKIEYFQKELAKVKVSNNGRRVTILLPKGSELAFSIAPGGDITRFNIVNDTILAGQNETVFYSVRATAKTKIETPEDATAALYATALGFAQNGEVERALEVLSDLGDIALVKALSNALTNAEFGRAEERIKAAISDENGRFLEGKQVGCLPDENAFDLLDLLALLQADKEARFYTNHPAWNYRRIGRGTEVNGEYPKFEPTPGQGFPFASLVWSSTELNLSLMADIAGSVKFLDTEGAERNGFSNVYPTRIYRNYALVANCYPNVDKLPVSLSLGSFSFLEARDLLEGGEGLSYDPLQIYVIDLTKIPVCNRAKSKGGYSAKAVGSLAVQSELLGGQIKGLKELLKELDPDKTESKKDSLTPEQTAFLKSQGIVSGRFSPPVVTKPATDKLPTRFFEVKVGKFSSLPSMKDVRAMAEKNKFTPAGAAVYEGIKDFEANAPAGDLKTKVFWLNARIAELNGKRFNQLKEINAARFGIALGNRWFVDLPTRADNKVQVELNGTTYDVTFDIFEKYKEI